MSRQSTATLNYQLTAYAQGHMNDLSEAITLLDRIAPVVPVPGTTGQYKKFNDLNSFKVYNTRRAMGGDPVRVSFEATDGTFNCKPNALEITVDSEERRQVGLDNSIGQQLLDEGKIKALLNVTAASEAVTITTAIIAALTAASGVGNWSNTSIDPIDQLDQEIDTLSKACGSAKDIYLDMDLSSWRAIRNHPKVKARVGSAQATPLTRQQLVDSLVVPVNLMISAISYDAAALGQTASKTRVMAGKVLLYQGNQSPTQYDPSPFKRFVVGPGNQIASVRSYMSANGFYDGHIIDWSQDLVQTSTVSCTLINVS